MHEIRYSDNNYTLVTYLVDTLIWTRHVTFMTIAINPRVKCYTRKMTRKNYSHRYFTLCKCKLVMQARAIWDAVFSRSCSASFRSVLRSRSSSRTERNGTISVLRGTERWKSTERWNRPFRSKISITGKLDGKSFKMRKKSKFFRLRLLLAPAIHS